MLAIFYNQYRDQLHFLYFGGEEGIRTLDTVARIHDFESRAFDHSATSPRRILYRLSFFLQGFYQRPKSPHARRQSCISLSTLQSHSPACFGAHQT